MKVAVVNLGQIVSGDWRVPFVAGDTILCEGDRIARVGTASASAVEAADVVMNGEHHLFGRPIGVMHDEGPAEPPRRFGKIDAVTLLAFLVALAQGLGTAGDDAVAAFACGELGAALVG